MDKEEEKPIHSTYVNQDRFTSFMFGGKRGNREDRKNEDIPPSSKKGDWILGSKYESYDNRGQKSENSTLSSLLNQVDMNDLFQNIDMLLETAGQFKPLWKQISPLIQKWKK
jgi:hypothetical protein